MSNRFTDQLLNPLGEYRDDVFWIALDQTLTEGCKFRDSFASEILFNTAEYTGKAWAEWKLTFFCLLAAFSDEDIDELVINWKE